MVITLVIKKVLPLCALAIKHKAVKFSLYIANSLFIIFTCLASISLWDQHLEPKNTRNLEFEEHISFYITIWNLQSTLRCNIKAHYLKNVLIQKFLQTSTTWNSHFTGSHSTPEWETGNTQNMNDKFVVTGPMRNIVIGWVSALFEDEFFSLFYCWSLRSYVCWFSAFLQALKYCRWFSWCCLTIRAKSSGSWKPAAEVET